MEALSVAIAQYVRDALGITQILQELKEIKMKYASFDEAINGIIVDYKALLEKNVELATALKQAANENFSNIALAEKAVEERNAALAALASFKAADEAQEAGILDRINSLFPEPVAEEPVEEVPAEPVAEEVAEEEVEEEVLEDDLSL